MGSAGSQEDVPQGGGSYQEEVLSIQHSDSFVTFKYSLILLVFKHISDGNQIYLFMVMHE